MGIPAQRMKQLVESTFNNFIWVEVLRNFGDEAEYDASKVGAFIDTFIKDQAEK